MNNRHLLIAFAWLACISSPKPACAIQTQEVDLGRDGVYDGIVRIVRDEHGRMTLCDAETSPVTLNDLRYNGVAHWLLLGLDGDDHPQYLNAARALEWLTGRCTSDLPEGSRLYFTAERTRSAVSAASPLKYDAGTGVFSADATASPVFAGMTLTGIASGTIPYATTGGSLVGNNSRLTISSAGNVGIATASPNEKLSVSGNIRLANDGFIYGSNNNAYINLSAGGGLYAGWGSNKFYAGGDRVELQTVNTTRLHISNSGDVGVGVSSPSARLDVNGTARIRGAFSIDGVTTSSALNIAGCPRLVRSSVQIITTDTQTVSPNAGYIVLDPEGNRNLGARPTIPAGAEGQILIVTNQDPACHVSFSNQSLLPGSNLALGAGTRTISKYDTLTLVCAGGVWCEIGFAVNH